MVNGVRVPENGIAGVLGLPTFGEVEQLDLGAVLLHDDRLLDRRERMAQNPLSRHPSSL
jgi:hypothetical protein